MSGLAKFCLSCGIKVTGSDRTFGETLIGLCRLGATVYAGSNVNMVENADAVVYSSAISKDDKELISAVKCGKKIFKRSEFLGKIVGLYINSIAVCGSHGKTTTTAMLTEIFSSAGRDPTSFIGGDSKSFGNFIKGKSDCVIIEACEYRRNFLDIHPKYALVTNIDLDHIDTYSSLTEVKKAFSQFISESVCFINADDENSKDIFNACSITFGIKNRACYVAKNIKNSNGKDSFTVYAYGKRLGRITLKTKGERFIYDAIGAVALATELKVDFCDIKRALENFEGVKRRNEFLGDINGVPCYADYAHHPAEIAAYLKDQTEKTLTVFQPHTYTRTAAFLEEFAKSLYLSQGIIVYKTYPAREKFLKSGDAKTLFNKIKKEFSGDVYYCDDIESLLSRVKKWSYKYDKIVFLGAGNMYDAVKSIVKRKSEKD